METVIPYLKKISKKTGLTALLAVPSAGGPLVSYISDALYGINIGAQIGTNLPLGSSTGVIFASFRNELVKNWLDSERAKLNEEQLKELDKELETARKSYFASKIEPLVSHVSSFSVPILNYEQELLGAITIVGYTETVPTSPDHPTSRYIMDISRELSAQYGFSANAESL